MQNIQVNLSFTADTSQAQAQLQSLQTNLKNLTSTTGAGLGTKLKGEIGQAVKAAAELSVHLKNATNVNTGLLDFSKLSTSIKQSGTTLEAYAAQLRKLGPQGQQAFSQLASSVAQSEVRIKSASAWMTKLGTTMMNTVRWQISASLLTGFIGGIRNAINYAEDLNSSLNSIRIVSGQSAEEMEKFAKQANRAAKELNTSTLAYTDASLIFYQQGLDKQAVKERTDTVIKMANVTREQAEDVSSYMTAIWNNFAKEGGESLEYYSDVLTALGATTASSTAEIAGGLEKFASVGSTIGLSYEYAASALATIVATTRQSEDVVGTALKTIFSRMQGLKLGETLDDGTTLNQYSENLAKVGVSIKDSSGELKQMDTILDEVGSKWDTLNKDQQVALAQGVAGIRQYTQFIALMDNWDFMKNNIETAKQSTGTLQDQADIYAESWEAANKRVKASAEGLYQSILDDDFFIGITDLFGDIIEGIRIMVDSFGGLDGVLLLIGAILTKIHSQAVATWMLNTVESVKLLSSTYQRQVQEERIVFLKNAAAELAQSELSAEKAEAEMLERQAELQKIMVDNAKNLSQADQERNKILMDGHTALEKQYIEQKKLLEATHTNLANTQHKAREQMASAALQDTEGQGIGSTVSNLANRKQQYDQNYLNLENSFKAQNALQQGDYSQLKANVVALKSTRKGQLTGITNKEKNELIQLIKSMEKAKEEGQDVTTTLRKIEERLEVIQAKGKNGLIKAGVDKKTVEEINGGIQKTVTLTEEEKTKVAQLQESFERLQNTLNQAGGVKNWAQMLASLSSGTMSAAMGIQSIGNAFKTLKDPNVGAWEKFLSVTMSLSIGLPSLINGFSMIGKALWEQGVATNAATLANLQYNSSNLESIRTDLTKILSNKNLTAAEKEKALAEKLKTVITDENTATQMANNMVSNQELLIGKKSIIAKQKETVATFLNTKGVAANTAAKIANLGITGAWIVGLAALAAVIYIGAKKIYEAYNAEALALERANEELKTQEEALTNITKAHEELLNKLKEYDTAYENLQKMTEGTEEWKNQVQELNSQVVDLITKYPELIQFLEKNNGVLSLSEEGLEEYTNLSEQKVNDAEYKKMAAQRRVNSAQQANDITDLSRKGFDYEDWIRTIGNASSFGAIMGTPGGPWGAGIGAITGAIMGISDAYNQDANSENYYKSQINDLIKNYETGGEEYLALESTQVAISTLASSLDTNSEHIIELIRTNKELSEINKLLGAQMADQFFADDENYKNSKYKDVIQAKAAEKFEQNKATAEDREQAKSNLFRGWNSDDYTDYLKAVYGEDAKNYKVTNTAGYDAVVKQYNPETQQYEEVGKIDQETAIEVVADMYARQRAEGQIKAEIDPKAINDLGENLEKTYMEAYKVSEETAIKLASTNMMGENVNFVELKQSDIDKIVSYAGEDKALQTYKDQALEFENQGGLLGAKNDSYKQLYDTSRQTIVVDATGSEEDIQQYEKMQSQKEEAKKQVDEIKEFYKDLNDEDKELFAETIDFKKAKNKELMESMLEDEKEKKAFASLDSVAEEHELDAEVLRAQAAQIKQALEEQNAEMKNSAEIAAEMAVANQRLNKGVNKLTDKWKDWKKALKSTDKTTQDYAEALSGVNEAVKDILGLTKNSELIPADFWNAENLNLLEQIGNGSEEAVQKLGANLVKASVDAEEFSADVAYNMEHAFDIKDPEQAENRFNEIKNNLLSTLNEMQSSINGLSIGDSLGAEDATKFATNLNDYAKATKMSVEEMQDILNSLGLKADIKTETQPMDYEVPEYTTFTSQTKPTEEQLTELGEGNWTGQKSVTLQTGSKKMQGAITVASIDMGDNPDAPPPNIQKVGSGNIASSVTSGAKNSSGGSSKKGKKEKTKKSDVIERYHEINKQLEKIADTQDKLADQADRLWGKPAQDALKKSQALLTSEINLLNQKQKLNARYLAEDKAAAIKAGFTFDDNGIVTNYDELLGPLYDELHALEEEYNKDGTSEARKEALDKEISNEDKTGVKDRIDIITKALETYETTWQEAMDIENEKADKAYEQIEKAYEEFNKGYEARMSLLENQIEYIDYQEKMLETLYGDDAVFHIFDNALDQLPVLVNQFIENKDAIDHILSFTANEYSIKWEELQEKADEMFATGEEAMDFVQKMDELFIEGMDRIQEKFDDMFDGYDKLTDKLEHYKNLLELTGRQQDYKSFGAVLQAESKIAQNELKSLQSYYDDILKPVEQDLLRQLQDPNLSDQDRALLEEQLKNVREKMDEAESTMREKMESIAEIAGEAFENTTNEILKNFEEALVGVGNTFEDMITNIDRLNKEQDAYLTKTNQIYETNKLIRQAQLDMDKTENLMAKQRYSDFQKELEQMQKSGQMSKFDLEVAQARYELLKAQIALEEAQNAKDSMKLTRDASGNWNYVYTANQDKISEAEQGVADAENNLYNLSLEEYNRRVEEQHQLNKEYQDELRQLQEDFKNGIITSEEEYLQKAADLENHYESLLQTAINEAAKAAEQVEKYSATGMIDYMMAEGVNIEDWRKASTTAIDGILDAAITWKEETSLATKEIGSSYEETVQKTNDIKTATEQLGSTIQNTLIPELDKEREALAKANAEYIKKRDLLLEIIELAGQEGKKANDKAQEAYDISQSGDFAKTMINEYLAGDLDGIKIAASYRQQKLNDMTDKEKAAFYKNNPGTVSTSFLSNLLQKGLTDNAIKEQINRLIEQNVPTSLWPSYFDKNYKPIALNTGGYTGEWGPDGRWALLHQKEIVLNAKDTENLLNAVDVVRQLENRVAAQHLGLLGKMDSVYHTNLANQGTLEQQVHIEAVFPSVNDRNEIQEAFNSLVNQAAQYASELKRRKG